MNHQLSSLSGSHPCGFYGPLWRTSLSNTSKVGSLSTSGMNEHNPDCIMHPCVHYAILYLGKVSPGRAKGRRLHPYQEPPWSMSQPTKFRLPKDQYFGPSPCTHVQKDTSVAVCVCMCVCVCVCACMCICVCMCELPPFPISVSVATLQQLMAPCKARDPTRRVGGQLRGQWKSFRFLAAHRREDVAAA